MKQRSVKYVFRRSKINRNLESVMNSLNVFTTLVKYCNWSHLSTFRSWAPSQLSNPTVVHALRLRCSRRCLFYAFVRSLDAAPTCAALLLFFSVIKFIMVHHQQSQQPRIAVYTVLSPPSHSFTVARSTALVHPITTTLFRLEFHLFPIDKPMSYFSF